MSSFAWRGVIEGFYGRPWSHESRLWLIHRLSAWGLNVYVHAPKDDPLHRAEWRTAYPPSAMAEFGELIERGSAAGVDVGFAVSPGLSITYSSPADVDALASKLRAFVERGARLVCLALDDVPTQLAHEADRRHFASPGEAHVHLAHALRERLGDGVRLWLVPTDYLGTEPTPDLDYLGEHLAPEIEVAWTGRTVVSPQVRCEEAARRAATLRRRLLLWDNVPVSDGPMRSQLHLAVYRGRDPGLAEHVSGVLLNPMEHARASCVTLRSAATYLADPATGDVEAGWREAVRELGAGAEDELELFARAHRTWAGALDDRDEALEEAFAALRDALATGREADAALARFRDEAEQREAVAEALRTRLSDRALFAELEPWIEAHEVDSQRIAAAARLLMTLAASAGDRFQKIYAFFAFEGRLTRIPPARRNSYGPRRVLYPQLVSMRSDEAGFGDDPVLVTGRNLADEIVAWVERRALEVLRT